MMVSISPNTTAFPNWKSSPTTFLLQWSSERNVIIEGIRSKSGEVHGFSCDVTGLVSSPAKIVISYLGDRDYVGCSDFEIYGAYEKFASETAPPINFSANLQLSVEDEIEPESESMKCPNCSCRFSSTIQNLKPIVLSCVHSVCLYCSSMWRPVFRCLKCGLNCYMEAGISPFNWNIMNLIDEKKSLTAVIEDPIVACFENDGHEADVYCNNCRHSFCQPCFDKSHIAKAFATHQTVSISAMPIPETFCSLHGDRPAISVCQNQDCQSFKLCCSDCDYRMHTDHTKTTVSEHGLQKVNELKTMVDELTRVETFINDKHESVLDCIVSYHPQFSIMKQCANAIIQHYEEKKKSALNHLNAYAFNQRNSLDLIEKELNDELDRSRRLQRNTLKRYKRKADIHLVDNKNQEYQDALKLGEKPAEKLQPLTMDHFHTNLFGKLVNVPQQQEDPAAKKPRLEQNTVGVNNVGINNAN